MPLETETIDLADEVERLRDERDELADQVATLDPENPAYERLAADGQEHDNCIAGLEWALEEWGAAEEAADESDGGVAVTLAGLTGGEYGRVQDRVDSGTGAARVHLVASGTETAPYYDPDADYETNLAAAAQLPFQYLKWAESRINELTTVGGNGETSFGSLVAERRQAQSDET